MRRPSGEIALDPDEQVQASVRLVFDLFEQRRTINGVLVYLAAHDIRLPYRLRGGPGKGELVWRRPNRHTLGEMLTNPAYAGAYVYGRRAVDPRRQRPGHPGSGRVEREPGGMVLLRDRWPAYISWEDHERNCAQVTANRAEHAGVPRGGPSLLAGLLACGRCGRRMATRYPQGGRDLRYGCAREAVDYGGAACQSLSGRGLDALVGGLIVEALAPAAVEVEPAAGRGSSSWSARPCSASGASVSSAPRYEAERARRQYDAVDPENRLVARTLERQWEQALAEELRLQAEHERFVATQPVPLTAAELAAIRQLTEDIPALWHAPTTTARDRQAIARLLLERVVVDGRGRERAGGGDLRLGRGRADRARPDPSGQAAGSAQHLPGAAGADRRPCTRRARGRRRSPRPSTARGGARRSGARRSRPAWSAPCSAAGVSGPRPATRRPSRPSGGPPRR